MSVMTETTPQLPRPFMTCAPGITSVADLLGMTSTLSRNRFLIVTRDASGELNGMIQFKGASVLAVEAGTHRGLDALRVMCEQPWSSMEAYDISAANAPLPTPIGSVDSMLLQVAVATDHAARSAEPDPELTDTSGLSEELKLSQEELQKLDGRPAGQCPFGFDQPAAAAVSTAPTTPIPVMTAAPTAMAVPAAAPVAPAAPTAVAAPAAPDINPEPVATPHPTTPAPTTPESQVDRLMIVTVIAGAMVAGILIGLLIGLS